MPKRKLADGVIPPEQAAEGGAGREEVRETSAAAYDPRSPVLCMDAQPIQVLKETRAPIAATKTHGQRGEYAYARHGPASICRFAEPLSGCRPATARVRRTRAAWASAGAQMFDTRYADGAEVTLVCDHRNTPPTGAFYAAFAPERARASSTRLPCCYTPQPGSWLPVADGELSCLPRQCLSDRRIGARTERQTALATWSEQTTAKPRGVAWQFRIANARVNLKRLYPNIKA